MFPKRNSLLDRFERAAAEVALGRELVPLTRLLLEYAERDSRICYVGVDTMDLEFQARFPDRAFDVGIAEQNQLGVATGLAQMGMIPVVQAWSPFTPLRNFEQLRTSLARHRANVKIVTTSLGLANCSHGTTHHDLETLALYRTVPNLTVLAPRDAGQFEQCFRSAIAYEGPVVLMGPAENYAPGEEDLAGIPESNGQCVHIGGAEILREGTDACLVSFGSALQYSWKAAERLADDGLSVTLLNAYSVKPFCAAAVLAAAERHRVLATVEEQSVIGGLGSEVAELLAESDLKPRFRRIGIPDKFIEEVGDWTATRHGVGLDAARVTATVKGLLAPR
jgi:transketolase